LRAWYLSNFGSLLIILSNTSSHALDWCREIVIITTTSSINKLLARVGVRIVHATMNNFHLHNVWYFLYFWVNIYHSNSLVFAIKCIAYVNIFIHIFVDFYYHVLKTINKQFCTCANTFPNEFTVIFIAVITRCSASFGTAADS
jgi:hypothetical protein